MSIIEQLNGVLEPKENNENNEEQQTTEGTVFESSEQVGTVLTDDVPVKVTDDNGDAGTDTTTIRKTKLPKFVVNWLNPDYVTITPGSIKTEEDLYEGLANEYVEQFSPIQDLRKARNDLLDSLGQQRKRNKEEGLKLDVRYSNELPKYIIPRLIMATGRICTIQGAQGEKNLYIYQNRGKYRGTWRMMPISKTQKTPESSEIIRMIRQLRPAISDADVNYVLGYLVDLAPERTETRKKEIVVLNNGIYDLKARIFTDWDNVPEEYTFTYKLLVNYNPNAKLKVFNNPDGSTWDVESGLLEMADGNEDMVKTMWQIFGAALRPFMNWERGIYLIDDTETGKGGGGKTTFAEIILGLYGGVESGLIAKLKMHQIEDPVYIGAIVNSCIVYADENTVGRYIDECTTLKNLVKNEGITASPKYVNPFSFIPHCLVLQGFNGWPRIKDTTGSFDDRMLILTFHKKFRTGNSEKTYIKDKYIRDPEVLEYVVLKALELGYFEKFDVDLPYIKENAKRYKTETNSVAKFFDEYLVEHDVKDEETGETTKERELNAWTLYPVTFLYPVYEQWMKEIGNGQNKVTEDTFKKKLIECCERDSVWKYDAGKKRAKKADMQAPEPHILEYGLVKFARPDLKGKYDNGREFYNVPESLKEAICCTAQQQTFRGCIYRED